MCVNNFILILILVLLTNFNSILSVNIYSIPDGFKFGVSTAAYQIEGGWNVDGKGENIWDHFTHTHTNSIKDHSTGDVACDSYNLWQEDVKILDEIGVDFYRFSLSWSRILPNGQANHINSLGVKYYNNLIDALIKRNIEPLVTLYHSDLPQPLQDLGGWTNYQIVEYFEDFARVAFNLFGDRVKKWITINEPSSICMDTYDNGNGAPGIKSPGIGTYICGKSILLAHARAYRLYQKEFKQQQEGKVGITIDSIWGEPKTNSSKDIEAAEREMEMSFGWFANPIFSKTGDYPDIMKSRISELSSKQNFTKSRLPPLSKKEIKILRGSADFFGLNHYHTWLISDHKYDENEVSFMADKGTLQTLNPTWKDREIIPWGFRKLLNWVKNKYDNPLVYITENGVSDTTGTLNDTHRVEFLKEYLAALFQAINEDQCNVAKYTVWSIIDNMEWTSGYTLKFGLYQVDFQSPARTRTAKISAGYYKNVIRKRDLYSEYVY